jgi:hypothetical protein
VSADIINLRRAHKSKARTEKSVQAERNRAIHGESKAERTLRASAEHRASVELDQHRREDAPENAPEDTRAHNDANDS